MDNDFTALVDTGRIEKAHAAQIALVTAERDAGAALETAKQTAQQTHAAAQAAADRGDPTEKLMAAEVQVDDADRAARVAGRVADAAARRRQAGARTLANEIKQAHGPAMQAGMKRFLGIRKEALDVLAKLEALKAEHVAVRSNLEQMANAAKCGIPNLVDVCHRLINDDGKMMDQAECDNRLNQPYQHEFDVKRGAFRWME